MNCKSALTVRAVTHYTIGPAEIERTLAMIRESLDELLKAC